MEDRDGFSVMVTGVRRGGTNAACQRNCGASAIQCVVALILTVFFVVAIAYASSIVLETVKVLGITTALGLLYADDLSGSTPSPAPAGLEKGKGGRRLPPTHIRVLVYTHGS